MDPRLTEVEIPLPGGAIQRLRHFREGPIQKSLEDALGRIGRDRRGVILRGRVDQDGGAAVLAARVNNMWSVGLVADYERGGDWGIGFETVFEW